MKSLYSKPHKLQFYSYSLKFLLIIGLLASSSLFVGAQEPEPQVPIEVRRNLSAQARKAGGSLFISKVVQGDINGDKSGDIAVNYAIEGIGGGNYAELHIAIFINRGGKYIAQAKYEAGATGTATGENIVATELQRGKVQVEILGYANGDGACCPSLKSQGELRLVGRKLILLRYKQ